MTRERLYLFDTTLRDGQQTQGVDFSAADRPYHSVRDGTGIRTPFVTGPPHRTSDRRTGHVR